MNTHAIFIFAYAAILIGGGIMGYVKAGSAASLTMGMISGLLLIATGIATQLNHSLAYFAAILLSGGLSLFFAFRFMQSWNFMPSGMMTLISLGMLVYLMATRE